jgi:hypothetical protein
MSRGLIEWKRCGCAAGRPFAWVTSTIAPVLKPTLRNPIVNPEVLAALNGTDVPTSRSSVGRQAFEAAWASVKMIA